MTSSLELRILQEQLRRTQERIRELSGLPAPPMPGNTIENSRYLKHEPVHSGPDYLYVLSSPWTLEKVTKYGTVQTYDEARALAEKHGYKGIRVVHNDAEFENCETDAGGNL